MALEFRVNNARALRLEPNASSPNVMGGYSGNSVTSGVVGATIGGGGYSGVINSVTANYGTVGGGSGNTAGEGATVGGGSNNTASGWNSTIAGGGGNTASYTNAAVGGGYGNVASGGDATVAGGHENTASGYYAAVGGGESNTALGSWATIGGGWSNEASNSYTTIAGGYNITVTGRFAAVGGGSDNTASQSFATVPGGYKASADHYGQMAYASGAFANPGDAQTSLYVMRLGASPMNHGYWWDLYLDGGATLLTIASGRTLTFDILVVGRSDGGESAGYRIQGVIENIGGTVAFIGTPTVTTLGEDDSWWDVQVLAEDGALKVQAMGNSETIRWVALVRTVEVSW